MLITCGNTLLRLLVLFLLLLLHLLLLPLLLRASPRLCMDCKGLHRLRLRYSERTNEPTSSSLLQLTTQRTNVIWSRLKVSIQLLTKISIAWDPWRNGSASDSRSEGCVFDSRRVQITPEIKDPGPPLPFCPLFLLTKKSQ